MSIQSELECDEVVRDFPGGLATIQPFSFIKETHIPDVPDRLYFVRGVALWWEIKTTKDKLTKGQFHWLQRANRHGALVGAGDAAALRAMVYGSLPSTWREAGWANVLVVWARGPRKEKP